MSQLTALETASGVVLGLEREPRVAPCEVPPLTALAEAIRPFLEHPPCLVSFSGGRDSSVVLAVAAALSRREGLPLPVPATNRFPAISESVEDSWQEQVVRELRLQDWVRLEFTDELDCVGPVATAALRRHGLLAPFNAHFHVPLLQAARGGALLTGIGGDELLGTRGRASAVVAGTVGPEPRDLLRVGLALAPQTVRRLLLQRRDDTGLRWLTASANRKLTRAWAAFAASEPLRWSAYVSWCARLRYLRLGTSSLQLLASDEGALIGHPFLDPRFLGALARGDGKADRATFMTALFGELLPRTVLTRSTKASFDRAFFARHSRAFAANWDGAGVDDGYVDVAQLRDDWSSSTPTPQTFTQLQSAWLAVSAGERVEEPLEPVGRSPGAHTASVLECG